MLPKYLRMDRQMIAKLREKPVPMIGLQLEEGVQVSEERVHVVLRVEQDVVCGQRGQNLVVAVLEIPVLSLPDGIDQLVLVKVHHLPRYGGQVGSLEFMNNSLTFW